MMSVPGDITEAATSKAAEAKRFASFVVTGGISAVFNLLTRWLLSHVLLYEVAVALAYVVGMTIAFMLARRFVFAPGGGTWLAQYRRFAAVNVVSLLIVLVVSAGLLRLVLPALDWTWHAEEVAHFLGVASPIVVSYFAHKHYSFARSDAA
jgi:putative flippase GtrA